MSIVSSASDASLVGGMMEVDLDAIDITVHGGNITVYVPEAYQM